MKIRLLAGLLALSSLACVMSVIPAQLSLAPATATLQPTDTANRQARVTAAETLYIRIDHSYTAKIVGYFMNGESVVVYECWGVWARVGSARWVNSLYLEPSCK